MRTASEWSFSPQKNIPAVMGGGFDVLNVGVSIGASIVARFRLAIMSVTKVIVHEHGRNSDIRMWSLSQTIHHGVRPRWAPKHVSGVVRGGTERARQGRMAVARAWTLVTKLGGNR